MMLLMKGSLEAEGTENRLDVDLFRRLHPTETVVLMSRVDGK